MWVPTGIVLVLAKAGDEGIAAVRHGEPRAERAAGSAHDHPLRGAEELHLWPPTSARRYVMGTRLGTPLAHGRRGMVGWGGKGEGERTASPGSDISCMTRSVCTKSMIATVSCLAKCAPPRSIASCDAREVRVGGVR